jgi:hypothetical protein
VEKSLCCRFSYHFSCHFLTIFVCFAFILKTSTIQGRKQQAAANSRVTPGGMRGEDDSDRAVVMVDSDDDDDDLVDRLGTPPPSMTPSSASEQDDNDEDTDDNQEDDDPAQRKKATKYSPHCDIQFVVNTSYKLLVDATKKVWGTAIFLDPQPTVPPSRKSTVKVGDYVLIRGKDITLAKAKGASFKANFSATDEFVLTKDWVQFDDDMTGADLQGLDDVPFLLWWQSVQPPTLKIPKKSAAALEAEKKQKKKKKR